MYCQRHCYSCLEPTNDNKRKITYCYLKEFWVLYTPPFCKVQHQIHFSFLMISPLSVYVSTCVCICYKIPPQISITFLLPYFSIVADIGRHIIDGPTTAMGIYWYLWVCVGLYTYVWVDIGIYGYLWVCMAMYRYVWVNMGIYGQVWVCIGMKGI